MSGSSGVQIPVDDDMYAPGVIGLFVLAAGISEPVLEEPWGGVFESRLGFLDVGYRSRDDR
ncbi:hypothetical protein GORHZ_203_00150 [Gordonia rhizosphera NBRC 16068]|uniref:Uncharacterized protein n=1 Tax=Gordonia rhizosphera NBRC 16068 TaxID=1108045 RepID=K6W1K9_9ACTN|nr:hypothetical protein GORHZ_203_00150 [Gordonia rhizosphera NBRC 16068]